MGQQHVKKTSKEIKKEILNTKVDHPIKIVLLGSGEVGKSTTFKQFKYLFDKNPKFTEDLKSQILIHFKKAYEAYKNIKPTFDLKTEEILSYIDEIEIPTLYVNGGQKYWNNDVRDAINILMLDKKFLSILETNHEHLLGDSCSYMLKRVNHIQEFEEMTKMDILRCYRKTTGLSEFSFKYKNQEFIVVDTGGQINERKKWHFEFEKEVPVAAAIFVSALSQYNEEMYETLGENKVQDQLNLLKSLFHQKEVVNQMTHLDEITDIPFYLYFNKRDVFAEEIQKQDISCCFPDCPKELKRDEDNFFLHSPKLSSFKIKRNISFELTKKPTNKIKVTDLSEDELYEIFSYLGGGDLCRITRVCNLFHRSSNSNNVWMNLCLKYDPELRIDKVKSVYSESERIFNMWKTYYLQCKHIVENSEKYLMQKYSEVTNNKIRETYKTCAIGDEFSEVILSTIEDILSIEKIKQYHLNMMLPKKEEKIEKQK
eukprot:gene6609-10772_t